MDLIIWNVSNDTLPTMKFENVREFKEDAESIQFLYSGISTQKERSAKFFKSNIAGYALSV